MKCGGTVYFPHTYNRKILSMQTFIIAAVSNYPNQFNWTKHNIGKNFLLSFIPEKNFREHDLYFSYSAEFEGTKLVFLYAKTYMNLIGDIFKDYALKNTYKNNPITILIHDDLELGFGKNKFRNNKDRGERGHNGLRSYNAALQSLQGDRYEKPFYFSLGIERPKDSTPVHAWVLQKFTDQEIFELQASYFEEAKKELYKNITEIKRD